MRLAQAVACWVTRSGKESGRDRRFWDGQGTYTRRLDSAGPDQSRAYRYRGVLP